MSIAPRDALFHQPLFGEPDWLETNWFSFTVPDSNLRCHIYSAFRTNLGVVFSTVMMWSRDCVTHLDFDHYDARIHLPMPSGNLDRYSLDNGLAVHMTQPLESWDIQYRGANGTVVDLHLEALTPAMDSRDTRVPGGKDFSHFHAVKSMAHTEVGHIDQTVQASGTVQVGGRSLSFNFPTNRDHSWSPRPEYGHGRGNFDEAYFGDDFYFHAQTHEFSDGLHEVTNGYLVEGGEVVLLKAGEARTRRNGCRMEEIIYEIEDARGRSHILVGRPLTNTPLPTFPNQFNLAGVTEWQYRGESGLGEYKWHWEVSEMLDPLTNGPKASND